MNPAPNTPAPSTQAPEPAPQTLQGWSALLADDQARADVLEKAFDFRGDCTLTLDPAAPSAPGTAPSAPATITGYIFDRRRGATPETSIVRLLTPDADQPVTLTWRQIARVDFGKDTAAGKSFETWLKNYVEKKRRGERASIESEPLE